MRMVGTAPQSTNPPPSTTTGTPNLSAVRAPAGTDGEISVVPSEPAPVVEHRYDRPHRPLGIRAVNRAGRVLSLTRRRALSLDPAVLVRHAAADQQADDFGSDEWREPLSVYTSSLERDAHLTPVGRYCAHGQISASLRNRLLLEQAVAMHPEMVAQPLAPATVIVGLPRTGSTLLQMLLAQDPQHRALLTWEAAQPVPEPGKPDARQRAIARQMRLLDYLAPQARSLHPIGPDLPTECVTLLANSLASLELATINWVPTYLDWCLARGMGPAYEYLYRQLQVLQARATSDRWLLKSPSHLFWLDDLLDTFPGAKIIQTHRDPTAVIGSFCSLSSTFSSVGSDHVPVETLSRRWAEAWADGLARTDAVRAARPDLTVADIRYHDLVADPLASVRRVYDELGLELSGAAVDAMRAFLAGRGGSSAVVHRYSLEQFGLDPAEEAERYAPYRQRYGV